MQKLVIDNTLYSILIYMLLNNEWSDSIFILNNKLDNKFLNNFQNKVKKLYIFKQYKIKNYYFKYIFEYLKLYFFILKQKNIIIYGNDDLEYFFSFRKNIFLIEDGLLNYKKPKKQNIIEILKKIIKLKNPFYKSLGYSNNVKKIYLTGLAPIPKEIKDKVEIINLKELWNKKSKEEKKEILNIFGFDEIILNNIKNKKYILFTQSLSEDNFMSENEKINLYKNIISNYDKNTLIIKTHPREKTDYKKYFPEIEVLKQVFPAELFSLLDIKFEKVITIYSTAVLNFSSNAEIDFYGTEINENLLKKLGSYDYIIKRNKFLK